MSNDGSRTGLIVGLVVGLVGFAAIVAALVGAGLYLKNKNATPPQKKPISRAAAIDQDGKPSKPINRSSTRNPRATRLPPINENPPRSSVAPVSTATTETQENSGISSSKTSKSMKKSKESRGIPLRTDIIRYDQIDFLSNTNHSNHILLGLRPTSFQNTYRLAIQQSMHHVFPQ